MCLRRRFSVYLQQKKKKFLTNENKIENEINLRPGWWPVERESPSTKKKNTKKQREMGHTREPMGVSFATPKDVGSYPFRQGPTSQGVDEFR
jgi:hypothetical protein